jgi:drug/metabolite transporter (DMT)-like permease
MVTFPASARSSLALIGAAASWGVGTAISKRAVDELPPLVLLAVQLSASLVALGVVMRLAGVPFRDPTASPILGRLGILNPGIAYLLSLFGLVYIGASVSVLVWATEPLWILALAALVLGERLGGVAVGASVVAIAGLTLVVAGGGATVAPIGVALSIAGVVCCAIYTVVARRWLGTADGTAPVVLAQQAYALGVVLVGLAVVAIASGLTLGPVTPLGWASAVVSGLLYYATAYWLYLSALRVLPASVASASFYLIPVFGVAASVVLLGERLEPIQWVGAIVVVGAVATVLRVSIRRAPAPDAATMEPIS